MARTREQIAESAHSLFNHRGYDATTLEEVAEHADVHKRTLLRYFPSKAHLVLHFQYAALEGFREAFAGRGDTPTLQMWRDHVVSHSRRIMETGRYADMRRIAQTEPGLVPAHLAIHAEYQQILARGFAEDFGPRFGEVRAQVAAAALVGGNFAIASAISERGALPELEAAELEVIGLVQDRLLDDV